jgi:hypothetical protein
MRIQYNECWLQEEAQDFSLWELQGIALQSEAGRPMLRLAPGAVTGEVCPAEAIDGGVAAYEAASGLFLGRDPLPAGTYGPARNYYNGGRFYFGSMRSPVVRPARPVNTLVLSWNAATPPGTWLQGHVRCLQGASWTRWYALPIWAADLSTIRRHSVADQRDARGTVETDSYQSLRDPITAYQISLTLFTTSPALSPALWRSAVIASYNADPGAAPAGERVLWGSRLAVPGRSQMRADYRHQDYGGGQVWCSPTSLSMVMAYWSRVLGDPALERPVPEVARGTYDFTFEGTGNWPFNTAYAATFGLCALVTRMYGLAQVEVWIQRGVPVVASLAWETGELTAAPLARSAGHLLVICGFTAEGDVIVHDPAAPSDAQVERVYPRLTFERLWQRSSHGVAYLIYPEGWPMPEEQRLACW